MGDVYYAAYYHLVWATKGRAPLLVPEVELLMWDRIRRKCAELKMVVYALNGMPDHVHLACSIPPSLAVSEAVGKTKGSSSHFFNHLSPAQRALSPSGVLRWQDGFGMVTFSKSDLPRVVRYIENQKHHHASDTLWPALERTQGLPESTPAPEGLALE